MDFKVGDIVIITDGVSRSFSRIEGVRKGHLRVGCLLFDWCGNEVGAVGGYRIFPLDKDTEFFES